jgi:hypothetical protein
VTNRRDSASRPSANSAASDDRPFLTPQSDERPRQSALLIGKVEQQSPVSIDQGQAWRSLERDNLDLLRALPGNEPDRSYRSSRCRMWKSCSG